MTGWQVATAAECLLLATESNCSRKRKKCHLLIATTLALPWKKLRICFATAKRKAPDICAAIGWRTGSTKLVDTTVIHASISSKFAYCK